MLINMPACDQRTTLATAARVTAALATAPRPTGPLAFATTDPTCVQSTVARLLGAPKLAPTTFVRTPTDAPPPLC